MGKYRLTTYLTLTGLQKRLNLADQAYGEWVIYDKDIPKYHVNCFDNSLSSQMIAHLIKSEGESIEDIIVKINKTQKVKLSLGNRVPFGIRIKSKLTNFELAPLPENWINSITQ